MPDNHLILLTGTTHDTQLVLQQEALTEAQIPCYVHHENGAASYPQMVARAHLILIHAEDLEAAKRVLRDLAAQQALPAAGGDWECPKCGESSGPTFTSCWKCGAVRDEW